MQVKSESLLLLKATSPILPPQPMVEPSGEEDCHTDCWSLCENNLGGSGYLTRLLLLYCSRVKGTIKGPTLSCTAALPVLNKLVRPFMAGLSANWRPCAKAVVGLSKVAARAPLSSTMPFVPPEPAARIVAYLA